MNAKLFTVLFILLLSLIKGFGRPEFFFSDRSGYAGQTVCMDVKVSGFTNMGVFNFKLELGGASHEFLGFQNFGLPGLSEVNFVRNGNHFDVTWSSTEGVTLPSGTVLFEVCYKIADNCDRSPMRFTNIFTALASNPTEYIGAFYNNAGRTYNLRCPQVNISTNDLCFGMLISSPSGMPGDTVCVDVSAEDFAYMRKIKFALAFDSQKLQFVKVNNLKLEGLTAQSFDTTQVTNGLLPVSWITDYPAVGNYAPDGRTMFSACFVIKGALGDSATVRFADEPGAIELERRDNNPTNYQLIPGRVYFQQRDFKPTIAVMCTKDAGCQNNRDGKIEIGVVGGQPPYTYQWTGPNGYAATWEDINALFIGSYYLTVTDSEGQVATTGPIVIGERGPLVTLDATNFKLCKGDTVEFKVNIDPNVYWVEWRPKYKYVNASCLFNCASNSKAFLYPDFDQLGAFQDTAQIFVISREDCIDTAFVTFDIRNYGLPNQPEKTYVCENDSLVLNKNNTLPDGIYNWQGPGGIQSNEPVLVVPDMTPANTGSYFLRYQSSDGCGFETSFMVETSSEYPTIDTLIVPDTICPNTQVRARLELPVDGTIYRIEWATEEDIYSIGYSEAMLNSGTQKVTITSNKGCSIDSIFTIEAFEPITFEITTTPSCDLLNAGTAEVKVFTGTPPFSYRWYNWYSIQSDDTTSVSGLRPGRHSVSIKDGNGCVEGDIFDVNGTIITHTSPTTIVSDPNTISIGVFTENGKTATWEPAGQYEPGGDFWIVPQPTENITYYVATVSDGLNCVVKDSILVVKNPSRQVSAEFRIVEEQDTLVWCYKPLSGNANDYEIKQVVSADEHRAIDVKLQPGSPCLSYFNAAENTLNDSDTLYIEVCPKQGGACTLVYAEVRAVPVIVLPGDTNDDGKVNHLDMLNIGIANGATGPERYGDYDYFNWYPRYTNSWKRYTPGTNINYAHIDANGDSTINAMDTLLIQIHWGKTHNYAGIQPPFAIEPRGIGVPLFIEPTALQKGQMVRLPVMLGDATTPAINAYGTAFTIRYNNAIVDPSSVSLEFTDSWLGTYNQDFIGLYKNFGTSGKIEAAFTRLNQQNVNGSGTIAYLNLRVREDVTGNPAVRFAIEEPVLISAQEEVLPVEPMTTEASITTSAHEAWLDSKISIFPNPAKAMLHIHATDVMVENVILYNVNGQAVLQNSTTNSFSVESLEAGLYFCKIQTDKGLIVKKISVIR